MPARRFHLLLLALIAGLLPGLAACSTSARLEAGQNLPLAAFSQNQVEVEIFLEIDAAGGTCLAATFTPLEDGAHLYALDLPRRGVDGVGRPTLLELPPDSPLQALGPLTASAVASAEDASSPDLRTYPPGPVTLHLPVALPPGAAWTETQVSVTYMVCKGGNCRPPVENRLVTVRLPGASAIASP
ncbi:MAG: hypothetical protein ABWK53_13260 [Anaerolineales bacterium]